MITNNFFVQRTLRSFFINNLQIENQFKEQSDIFENLSDGAVIFKSQIINQDKYQINND